MAHSTFTQEIADKICERLSDGESLRSICRDENMPGTTTVLRWLSTNDKFRSQYAHARELQADALADQILDISNTPVIGETITIKETGGQEIKRADMIEHRRLQIDARKWYAGKLRPKVYGTKHVDADVKQTIENESAAEIAGRIAQLLDVKQN